MPKYRRAFLDFETRSRCDLKARGTDNYAHDESTEITIMVYAFDEEPPQHWYPNEMDYLPEDLFDHVNSGGEVWAHNATFEYNIWNHVAVKKYGFPKLSLEQCYCTMSMANAMGLMGGLDGAAACAGLDVRKDKLGYRTMLMLCQPRNNGNFWERTERPDLFKILDDYCVIDVEIERQLSKRLRPLSPRERQIWILDQKVNERGVGIDIASATRLDHLVDVEKERLLEEFKVVTSGYVPSPASHVKFKGWLKAHGIDVPSIAKDKIKLELDKNFEECPDCGAFSDLALDCGTCGGFGFVGLPPVARKAVLIRQEISKSSNAKIKMMLKTEYRGRARYMFEYYGAKQTGRWAGRKIQLQNLPRTKLKYADIMDAFDRLGSKTAIQEITLLHGNLMQVASECLRSLLIAADGHRFIACDWSNIEGRGLAWLASEEWKLQAFREYDAKTGPDLYKLAYAKSFHTKIETVDDEQRQIGKTLELACGYQGATGAFQMMAKTLGVKVKDARAKELVDLWRQIHPRIKNYWYALEEAAVSAIQNKGKDFSVGKDNRKVVYNCTASFLRCLLPSGRMMYYPYPRYEQTDAPWGGKKMSITYAYQDAETKKWTRGPTYGGSLCENITQGICRDILAEGMLRVESHGYKVVIHVHDEIVAEMKEGEGSLEEFRKIMCELPKWADGFPIAAGGWEGKRYRK